MKYLNRIIFVNSANIPYAEISVDGNVHFTGTQGVGKSTILRALLFFYNADKHKLGIQQGQKSFDEFYFRQSNSYILYEVMGENSAYTILLSRFQGHASWRFIDAPYKKEWLLDGSNQVLSDWVRIRERIDKNTVVSARIDSGNLFRDIIFGNTHDKKYTRYALVQSAHYQNIPRSIQNVFLNTKLDADFVKNTIIQSMADEDLPVDLQSYRRLVTNFEREYDEIDCWFRKAKDGSYPVRNLAVRIAETGSQILALDQQLKEIWRMLNFAVSECEREIPLLEAESENVKLDIEKEQSRRKELSAEYNKEKDSLNQELGAQKAKLKDISQLRKKFEDEDISSKLALAAREESITKERSDRQMLLSDLLKTHESIEEKYKIAREKVENSRNAFENTQKDTLFRKQEELQGRRKKLEDERTSSRNQTMDAYNTWRRESDERLHLLYNDQHSADNAVKELRHFHPRGEEIQQIDKDLLLLDSKAKENASDQQRVKSEMDRLQAQYDIEEKQMRAIYDRKRETLDEELKTCLDRIGKIDSLLSHYDGSLYKWLTENVQGWENTIGKVVDEKRILYSQGLEPAFSGASDYIFGIRLNLDAIDSVHRTPDDYRLEKSSLEEKAREIKKQLSDLPSKMEEEIAALGKRYTTKLNPLRQEAARLRLEEQQMPTRRKNLETSRHQLEMEEEEIISEEMKTREKAFNDSVLAVKKENDERSRKEEKNKKDLKALDTAFNRGVKELDEELRGFKNTLVEETRERLEDFTSQLEQLKIQQNAELAGKGVDMKLLGEYRKSVEELDNLLKRIEEERPEVIRYRDAEENLFSREPEIRKNIKDIEGRLDSILRKYQDKQARIEKMLHELEEHQRKVLGDLAHRREGTQQYRQVVDGEHIVPASFQSDEKQLETKEDCQALISRLRGTVNQKRESIGRLKDAVVKFNCNFKPQNAFHFNTVPVLDEDYLNIAANLQEFMDNNKIEEYRRRTSEHYKDILGRVASEIGNLLKRRSDVDGVIQDINRDFVEKNFAGVIRSIQLRADESSDRLMQLLMSIHNYSVENSMSIGELNLFSGDNRDEVNLKVVDYLKSLSHQLLSEPSRRELTLGDAFRLQFRVRENDNDTGWVERINNVGSDGTDILVKAMVNIMLINVFKKKAARKSGDFIVHCMMDEIGRLHPNNIKGILQFANSRNIYLINSSPTSYNPYDYKYTYLLSKHGVKTRVDKLMKRTK